MNDTPARNKDAISSCRMVQVGAVYLGPNRRKGLIPLPTIAEVQENEEQEDNQEVAVSKPSHYFGRKASKRTRESTKELDVHVKVEFKSSDFRLVGVACVIAAIAFLVGAWKA